MIVSGGASASPEAILKAVASTGMSAEPWQEISGSVQKKSGRQKLQLALTISSGVLTALAFGLNVGFSGGFHEAFGAEGVGHVHRVPWFSKGAYLCAMVSACWFIAPKAWLSAKRLRPDMNLLMAVAILGAMSIVDWFEAATVAFLFAVSNALEGWSLNAIRLLDISGFPVAVTDEARRLADPLGTKRQPPSIPLEGVPALPGLCL
jgi:Cd2+/Zn2+-exporting ATPase